MRRPVAVLGVVLALIAGLYLAALAWLYTRERALLFPGARSGAPPSVLEAELEGFQDAILVTKDGERLAAWWKPPAPSRAVVLYLHGNGGTLAGGAGRARLLGEGGRGVLILAYRGYPGSTGAPTEAGLALDARAAHDRIVARAGGSPVVLYGESLGSAVAVRLAAERAVAGVILDAPFTSIPDVARTALPFVPLERLMRDQFRSIDHIAAIRAPLLVLHGERDRIVPIGLGERLFAAAAEPKRFVRLPDVGHAGVLEMGGLRAVRAFLDAVETGRTAAMTGESVP